MLIDDNADDNFYHKREIQKANPDRVVLVKDSGTLALDYIKTNTNPHSDLIFLDINMPGMNGWEFLKEYTKLDVDLKSRAIIIMLTTSDNADDRARAKAFPSVTAYTTKPLTRAKVDAICKEYFT